jgi:hypothetical protein
MNESIEEDDNISQTISYFDISICLKIEFARTRTIISYIIGLCRIPKTRKGTI